ncbi:MAG: hypothetical protein HYZ45_09865, partial [Burkholderiales bacterium]|nr:hypothetical protein [Burkholderiales bacterium]
MTSPFYLPRKLFCDGKTFPEAELTATSRYVVVLAEPGGGKTALLESLARQLGTAAVTANFFAAMGECEKNRPLVIDAFDELAKIDQTGINKVLAYAKKANPTHVIISSRSSEWNEAATHRFKEFLGEQPLVVRLCEFNEDEQREIFQDHAPNENFTQFQSEVARFDLAMLLPNPQFLKLFADAFLESGKRFANKRSIFEKAVERLAREANLTVTRPASPLSAIQKIDLASAAFAKLLLSGAEGVCTSEATESHLYPLLLAMTGGSDADYGILATRLFKPGDHPNLHRPVHKIVTEYCAASYLIKRIADPTNGLTLSKCLAIIAPNSVVRDELRGLLGWMAALGNEKIQEAAIKLDAYAILANGDPSQLAPSSKLLLIRQLKEIETHDPYFRRGDAWRRFSVAGFFTQEVVDEIKLLLTSAGDGNLRDLMLELLAEAPVLVQLTKELQRLALAPQESADTRSLANRRLLEIASYDHRADLKVLISEGSHTSLKLAAESIEVLGTGTFERTCLTDFFHACTKLYPSHKMQHDRTIGERYFIKQCIDYFDLATIEWLLDDLTTGLTCHCGTPSYKCDCRNGISKIVGAMLDRYFILAAPPFDPVRIWRWGGNLNFHGHSSPRQSKAVQVLQENDDLRRGVLAHVLGGMTDRNQIFETRVHKLSQRSHLGFHLRIGDAKFLMDMAFETDNPNLWANFIATHECYSDKEERVPNNLRQHMRKQALKKPLFMAEWVTVNRAAAQSARGQRLNDRQYDRNERRRRKKEASIRAKNIKFVQENRELVENGRHWGFLKHFAELVLFSPEKIAQEYGDENMVRNALRNCLDFIKLEVPHLGQLAEIHCASQGLIVERILYAACLEKLRLNGNLGGVDFQLLKTLRTNLDLHYHAVSDDERKALTSEIDRLSFPDTASIEDFLRQYIEPQLAQPRCLHPKIWMLQNGDIFSHLRATLSLEWLKRFPNLALEPLATLFGIAAQYSERDQLNQIITERSAQLMADYPTPTNDEYLEKKREFWLVHAWHFLPDTPETYWHWLKSNKDSIFLLNGPFGPYKHEYKYSNDHPYWTKLSANKVEAILTAFIEQWPKVDLPNSYGSASPSEEKAYRFLTEIIWLLESHDSDDAIPVLDRLLADSRFADMHMAMKSILAAKLRKQALQHFQPPTPQQIHDLLEHNQVVTVEGLRQLVVEELEIYQKEIFGGEFNQGRLFYAKG